MTQSAKIIDVTRSFIPVDPNAYPETLHSTSKEDFPEQRVPVVPYKGYNFLPTSYGYKSFFGTTRKINISSLSPNKADKIFMFQTDTFKNILVALCDTGIWYKNAGETGAWTQAVAIAALADGLFYEWYFTTIKNKLYVFRNNGTAYYQIESDPVLPSATGIICTAKVPNFITITAQLGMSRIGSRLCFWDTTNAIAWCNPDDFLDFTPAVLTGANVTTFNVILGKISAIRPHGQHSIVYASKSVTLLAVNATETFFVKAQPILNDAGCAYQNQSVEAMPNDTHFVYTSKGIYKIVKGAAEVIIPEVFDYFANYITYPIYLYLLQGRYLCFEALDTNMLSGSAQFTRQVIPPANLIFAADKSYDAVQALDPATANLCDVTALIGDNFLKFSEAQAAADAAVPPSMRKPGTLVQPKYTCYLADQTSPDPDFIFGQTPCGVAKIDGSGSFKPSPLVNNATLDKHTTTPAQKTAKTGAQVYIDGKWTMQRFVQYQTALWEAGEKNIEAFLSKLRGYAEVSNPISTINTLSCTVVASNVTNCDVGIYPKKFSAPQFGINKCSFWLTRYVIEAAKIVNRVTNATACNGQVDTILACAGYRYASNSTPSGPIYATPELAVAAQQSNYPGSILTYVPNTPGGLTNINVGSNNAQCIMGVMAVNGVTGTQFIVAWWQAATDKICAQLATNLAPGLPTVGEHYIAGHYDKLQTQSASNAEEVYVTAPVAETGYCVLSGYEYTDISGNLQTVGATCPDTNDKYPGTGSLSNPGTRTVPLTPGRSNLTDADGAMCSVPYDSSLQITPVAWTDQTLTYPGVNFLLQLGSIAPRFPTKAGAFVYDLHLKKWGKMKLDYKQLLDYSPINSASSSTIDFSTFGIVAGALKADGFVYVFDNKPTDARITWGKVGYYRLGMTDPQEIRIDFASLSNGSIVTEVSLDGVSLGTELTETTVFNGAMQKVVYPKYAGKWFNITVTGQFDINFVEFRGLQNGRR